MVSNDNDSGFSGLPQAHDAHGKAALLLVESLIHALCENATLNASDAIEIAERAVSVQFDKAEAADPMQSSMWDSHSLLMSIAASLRTDGPSEA